MARLITRRNLIASIAAGVTSIALSACTGPTYNLTFQDTVLSAGDWLAYRIQRLIGGNALAPEFSESEMSPVFRTNGNTDPDSSDQGEFAAGNFSDWQLRVDGLVSTPAWYSLAQLRARCHRAARSHATTASRAGAPLASGPAFNSDIFSSCRTATERAFRGVPLRRSVR